MTLAAVDEGILQLTKFQSPDPVDYYFEEGAGVEIYDDYGRLLDRIWGFRPRCVLAVTSWEEGLSVVPTRLWPCSPASWMSAGQARRSHL